MPSSRLVVAVPFANSARGPLQIRRLKSQLGEERRQRENLEELTKSLQRELREEKEKVESFKKLASTL